jgi:hypothetical protein
MFDFTRLAILPDELALSYRARLARVNGWESAALVAENLSNWIGRQLPNDTKLSGVEVLAYVAGMGVTQFVRSHTMLPFQRAVVGSLEEVPHGCTDRRSLLEKRAYCATREHFYFCRACAEEDMNARGTPYWRRSHQLPGMLWCTQHEIPLTKAVSTTEHLVLPNDCLEKSEQVPLEEVNAARSNPNVLRFINISSDMLASERPIHESNVYKIVKDRIKNIQEEPGGHVFPILQSRFSESLFDLSWLNNVFTRGNKTAEQTLKSLDDLITRGTKGVNSVGYALLLACLYETSDEAMNQLTALDSNLRPRKRSNSEAERSLLNDQALRDAYFAGLGNHVTIAKNLGLQRLEVKRRMETLGLPPKRDLTVSDLLRNTIAHKDKN